LRVGEGHPRADPDGVAGGVDADAERLVRPLPPRVRGEAEDGDRGGAVGRESAVPVVAHDAPAAGHVALPGQDEDELVGRRQVGADGEEEWEDSIFFSFERERERREERFEGLLVWFLKGTMVD
jgi:hypothetical protein